jgi:hypothetical protein
MSREKRNYIILTVMLIVFVVIVVNQFVLSSDNFTESPTTDQMIASTLEQTPRGLLYQPSLPQGQESAQVNPEQGVRPLPLRALEAKSTLSAPPSRNLFRYYVPPPPPPEPIIPPPLAIDSVDPTFVYAGTKAFTLRVSGRDLPEDAQIFVNGQALPTTHVSESVLSATVEKRLIATLGQLRVEVKNTSGDVFSNPFMVNVERPPAPPYKYVGRIGNLIFLESGDSKRLKARVGETVEKRWRLTKIVGEDVVLEDIALGLQHTMALPKPQPGMINTPIIAPGQRSYPRRVMPTPQRIFRQQAVPSQNLKPNANAGPQKKPQTP